MFFDFHDFSMSPESYCIRLLMFMIYYDVFRYFSPGLPNVANGLTGMIQNMKKPAKQKKTKNARIQKTSPPAIKVETAGILHT